MIIHHLRNATFVIESGDKYIIVDPMLGGVGTLPPFAYFRHTLRKNPVVPLPENAESILGKVTHCLLTHSQKLGIRMLQHTDHLDKAGAIFLAEHDIPIATCKKDVPYLKKNNLFVDTALEYWQPTDYLGGTLTAVPALHGHSWIRTLMANGAGFFLQLEKEPTLYIAGDTVVTLDVDRVMSELKPDISVMASGSASLDIGKPILMTMDEMIQFVKNAPGKVIANHLEALNHCPTTRAQLKQALKHHDLLSKVFIPDDGDVLVF